MMLLDCRTDSEQEVREQERGSEPVGTGDDAFAVLDIEPTEGELLGIFHHRFEGDREHTQSFLKQFKRFMMMNRNASIARDPIARCLYFFSLLKGPEAELWVERNDSWLLEVESDPSLLLPGKSAWDIVEGDFKQSFFDYAGPERAFIDIQKLKMKEDKVDEYIATFESLGRRAGMDLDDPSALRMFARGLPRKLAEACIFKDNPENFEQWAKGARRQHQCAIWRDWYLSNDDGPSQSSAPQRSTNTIVRRKATTESEKQRYLREERCFKCSKQGHIARNCSDRS